VTDNGNIVARSSSKSSTVTNFLLNVRDDSSFRDRAEREDVSDRKVSVLAGVDELTSVHALVRDEGLGVKLESVGIAEDNLCERSPSARIMDDCTNPCQKLLHGGRRMLSIASNPGLLTLLHNASNVTMPLSVIEGTELRRRLVKTAIRSEDATSPLPLVSDDATLSILSAEFNADERMRHLPSLRG
jgi:hypothetical protein